ncbi:zinc finger protein 708-like [Armigeres subalbatus]|uniref:zinc finger protein 708-like n=1 Tax=Armigeres subalbatus TaxID=124917 RepID=UPI002ED097C8
MLTQINNNNNIKINLETIPFPTYYYENHVLKSNQGLEMAISEVNYLLCCRICLGFEEDECFLDLFSATLPETTVELREALQKSTGIEYNQEDSLPSKICQSCLQRLQDTYNFISECIDNSSVLESLKEHALSLTNSKEEDDLQVNNTASDIEESFSEISVEVAPNVTELLQIECLQTPNERYAIYELNDGYVEQQSDITPKTEALATNVETAHDKPTIEEQAPDAVDFILRNLMPADKERRKRSMPTERRYQCQVCDKTFQRKSNLVDHLRLHANVKLFACSYCSAAFVQAGNLKSHIRKHTLEKPFKCDHCGKSYSQSGALKTHIRTHTNERNYVCDICNKAFTNSSDLNKHKMTHSDLRFYQCVLCSQRYFIQKVHLKKHLRSFHRDANCEELLEQGTLKKGVAVERHR